MSEGEVGVGWTTNGETASEWGGGGIETVGARSPPLPYIPVSSLPPRLRGEGGGEQRYVNRAPQPCDALAVSILVR